MTGDCHVPFCGSPGVKSPRATRPASLQGPRTRSDARRTSDRGWQQCRRWQQCRAWLQRCRHRSCRFCSGGGGLGGQSLQRVDEGLQMDGRQAAQLLGDDRCPHLVDLFEVSKACRGNRDERDPTVGRFRLPATRPTAAIRRTRLVMPGWVIRSAATSPVMRSGPRRASKASVLRATEFHSTAGVARRSQLASRSSTRLISAAGSGGALRAAAGPAAGSVCVPCMRELHH